MSSELNKVKFPPAIIPEGDTLGTTDDDSTLIEDVKHLTLGSRKNLCINPDVKKLRNATAINERCLELQQPKTSSGCKCPWLPTKENQALVKEFRDHALARIRDIEDLGSLGRKIGICPYYASRPTTKYCEVSRDPSRFPDVALTFPDGHASVSIAPAEIIPRSIGPDTEEPCCHYR
jgi:chromosome transmission fidelity protein 1